MQRQRSSVFCRARSTIPCVLQQAFIPPHDCDARKQEQAAKVNAVLPPCVRGEQCPVAERFRAGIVAPEEAGLGPHDVLRADAVPLRQAIIHGHACVHLCQFLRKLSALPPK